MQTLVLHQWRALVLGLSLWFSLGTVTLATSFVSTSSAPLGGLEVICPSNITVYAANGLNGAYVTWAPISAKTDCPLCAASQVGYQPLGIFNGHHYFLSNSTTDWNTAAMTAANQGGYLASINTDLENQFIANQLAGIPAFIGMQDQLMEGNYQWHSGEPVTYTLWESGQPDNGNGQSEQDAVLMSPTGYWQDVEILKKNRYVMEFPCVVIQQTSGYPSGSFFPTGTTTVSFQITDQCGNQAICSFSVTVLPNITVDCPKDIQAICQPGINGAVVSWNLPTASTQCGLCGSVPPNTIDMGTYNGSHYYCTNSPFQWTTGQAFASSYGGYLACIGSAGENQYLQNILQLPDAFIGMNDLANEGQYKWANNQPLGYFNWAIGHPENLSGNEDVVTILSDGKWKTIDKQLYKECIIEVSCLQIIQIKGPPPGSVFPLGETEIQYKITDECGNIAYCTFKVVVSGGLTITCPDDVTLDCQPGKDGATYSWTKPSLSTCCEDCPDGDPISGFLYMGEYQGSHYYCSQQKYTWATSQAISTANGGHLVVMNSLGENQFLASMLLGTVAWIGLTDEQVEGQFAWVNGDPLSFTRWTPGQPDNGGFYNEDHGALHPDGFWSDELGQTKLEFIMEIPCESLVQLSGPPSGSCFPVGKTVITYKATDGCGEMATCSFSITVKECCLLGPEIQCPDDYYACPDTPMDPNTTGWAMSWTPDGPCGKVLITWTDQIISQGNCWDKVIKRTWKAAFDANPQLYSTCIQYIYLQDNEPPTFWDCPKDVTVAPGPDCSVKVGWAAPLPMDNCGSVTTTVTHQPGSTFYEGTTIVTYTFIDACGNKTQCSFKVTVTTCCKAPAITCPPDYHGCPEESASPLVTGFATTSTPDGACGNVVLEFDDEVISMGNCWNQTIKRTWKSYFDAQPGLYTTCEQLIVLEDKVAPVIGNVPDDLTLCPGSPLLFGNPAISDNCGPVTLTYEDQSAGKACEDGYVVTRIWSAEDGCGNITTASQTITQLDKTPPVIWDCPKNITVEPNEDCEAIVSWSPPGVMDNCSPVSVLASHAPGSVFQEGTTTVTYTVLDECGNKANCSFTITIEACCVLPEMQCPGKYQACPGEPTDPSVAGEPTLNGADDCGLLELTFSDWIMDSSGCPGSAKIGRTWTLTAVNDTSKTVSCVQWVQTIDEEAPLFDSCPQNIVIYTEEWCPVVVFWNEPQVTDNCSDFELTFTHYSGDTYYPGETEVQYWADDICGNASFCIFTIEVIPLSGKSVCVSGGENTDALWVEEVSLQGQTFTNGNNCGWGGSIALEPVLAWDDEVTINVLPGYSGEALTTYIRAWADWNRDGDFLDFGEMIYDAQELNEGPITFQTTVPQFAVAGPSFIRVSVKYTNIQSDPTLPESCSMFAQGEVEDLLVQLGMTTDIAADFPLKHIQLFPNPATNRVRLSWNGDWNETVHATMLNHLGQEVKSWSWKNAGTNQCDLDISGLPAGMYVIDLRAGTGQTWLKLIIQ